MWYMHTSTSGGTGTDMVSNLTSGSSAPKCQFAQIMLNIILAESMKA